jgi:hypothetical protein
MAASAPKTIRLRFPGTCVVCGEHVAKGVEAWWNPGAHQVTCLRCRDGGTEVFVAGRSAQRTADRARAREANEWKQASFLKKVVIVARDKPSSATSWSRGAIGERLVGGRLDRLAEQGLIFALHDIRIPGTKANVDHVAVAPSGVHIIDSKYYENKLVEVVDKGGWLRRDEHLFVGRRDCTKLVHKLAKQILVVDAVTRDMNLPTVVTPVLCFVDAEWKWFSDGYTLDGVRIVYPDVLEKLLRRPGPLGPSQIASVGERLATQLRPA